ncbi:glycoside hydrolase family 28 protein [Ceratobasidium sp. AG-Ba]|nr:glycoside hydrolase family 28 protein [Ceratobasidium sp. AG-Ba]
MSYQQQPYQEHRFQQGHQPTGSVGYDYPHPTAQPEYNPYSDYNTVNAGYGQGGPGYGQGPSQTYRDEMDDGRPGMPTMQSQATAGGDYDDEKLRRPRPLGANNAEGRVSFVPPKSTGDLRLWRHDEHGNVWTKGSRTRCVGRFCCCTVMTTIFLIVSIALTLGLWVRPPDISFNGIKTPTNGSTVVAQTTGITINLNLAIGVVNPNFFAADFSAIQAKAFYPGVSQQIGGGTLNNINFPSHSDTSFLFPFSINYTESIDPNRAIIKDIAVKCGFIGNTKSDIPVNYQLTLKLKVLGLTISPSFSGSASFSCPLQASDISGLGIDMSGLLNGS